MAQYFSLDVECIATGKGHSDRSPCSVAVVNDKCEIVLSLLIKPASPVFNYLTPFTGLKDGDLDGGVSLESAICQVKGLLGKDVILVGQRPQGDIKWLQLEQGIDYYDVFDLAPSFATKRQGREFFYSLQQEAKVLLDLELYLPHHDPTEDAIASMKLFNLLKTSSQTKVQSFKEKLQQQASRYPSTASQLGFCYQGVCLSAMNPNRCTCDQPMKC